MRGKFARMKLAVLTVIAVGCGGRASPPEVPPPAAVGPPAMRWVPANPTYLFASQTLGDGQRSLRDAIALAGGFAGFDVRDVAHAVSGLIGVDALAADPIAAIGVDLRGSWAVFSDNVNPTIVVHLAAPEQMAAFLDRQRERGLVTQSVVVDRTEVFSATLIGGLKIGWAIAGDWMWIHVALPFTREEPGAWFAASHAPHRAGWADDWAWAKAAAGGAAGLIGYFGRGTIARAVAALPDAAACARLVELAGRVAVALEGDERHVAARIALEVGSTATLGGMVVAPPPGWEAATAQAALGVQWNLDAVAARAQLARTAAPCLALAGGLPARLDETGVRTARAAVLGFDADAMSGTGAVAFDLTSAAFFERQLDRIPLRRAVERAQTFGAHRGRTISIPFSVTVDYVLEPRLAIAALGDGLLARLVAPGAPRAHGPPIFALDLAPPALSAAAWETMLNAIAAQQLSGAPSRAIKRVVEHLMHWRDVHLAVTAEPTALVLAVSGHRR
jgi:hypothetical protein